MSPAQKSARRENANSLPGAELSEEFSHGTFMPADGNPWRTDAPNGRLEPPHSQVDDSILYAATHGLANNHPDQSAKHLASPSQVIALITLTAILVPLAAIWPIQTLISFNVAITLYFMCAIAFRLWLLALGWTDKVSSPAPTRAPNQALPVVTILLPLYRDASALPMLAEAIDALDYPASKKDVKLLLEEDDQETIVEAYRLRLDLRFHIVIVPDSLPRTKPKACNVGLAMAQGELIVIYDAEDSPESDQLRKAAAAFADGDETLACVQARLNYYNKDDNWLARLFTLEYSLWFDWLLPALQKMNAPIPLGGTSNIFSGIR